MTLDLPNLVAGTVLGAFSGYLVSWAYARREGYLKLRQLSEQYSRLAGDYANFRVTDGGKQEATGGTIRLNWQREGFFRVQGLHANGVAEWESDVRMSQEFSGTGTGHYRYVGKEYTGTQQLTYMPETRSFVVMGTSSARFEFVHYWRRIER